MSNSTGVMEETVELQDLLQEETVGLQDLLQEETVGLQDLLPTIVQIFVTIKLGWLAGNFNVIGPQQAKGLNIFVGKYSLPALVFISLATLDLSQVNLAFLLGISASKLLVFLFTILSQSLIFRDVSRGAMWAMFCTQTNDFAMGVPLLQAVLGEAHPYVSYLYLVAPVSLVLLNPVGFIILEANRKKDSDSEGQGRMRSICSTLVVVVKGLVVNPIIVMTLLGILTNLIFSGQPPATLQLLLSKLGAAFSSTAPFTLGLALVGKMKHLRGGNLSTIFIMMIIKCILAPITTHCLVGKMHSWLYNSVDRSLMNFSFLYGTFPPALAVTSYASQYNVSPELVSAGLVLCTAVSAPLMFFSAQILNILTTNLEDNSLLLSVNSLDYNVAIASIIAVSLILTIFLVSRRYSLLPHCITTAMLVESLLAPAAAVLLHFGVISWDWQKMLHTFGVFSVQMSSAVLGVCLILILKQRHIGRGLQIIFVISPPIISASVILLASIRRIYRDERDSLDLDRNIATVLVSCISLVLTSGSLAYIFRRLNDERHEMEESQIKSESSESPAHSQPVVESKLCSNNKRQLEQGDHRPHFPQVFRHSLLLLLLLSSMIADLTLALWRLANLSLQTSTGTYKVMLSLDVILTTGQGLLIFSIFVLDCHYILNPLFIITRKVKKKLSVGRSEVRSL